MTPLNFSEKDGIAPFGKILWNNRIVIVVVQNLKFVNYMIKQYKVNVFLISYIIILIN